MSSADVYGRLLSAAAVERGVECTLRYFLPQYLGEVLDQAGHPRDGLPDPTDLVRVAEFAWPVESAITLVVVATPGTIGDARRETDSYTAVWDVRAAVLADLGDRLESREAAQFYVAAAGAALAHQGIAAVNPDLRTWQRDDDGELVMLEGSQVRWLGETYRVVDRRAPDLIAGEARILVTVEGARSVHGGPLVPPDDPVWPSPRDPAVPGVPSPVTPDLRIERLLVEEPSS